MMTMLCRVAFITLIAMGWVSVAIATIQRPEVGDAGEVPANAQNVPELSDPLDGGLDITGALSIPSGDQGDMFRLEITNPTLFSASVSATGGTLEGVQLFLFDENGVAICANSGPVGGSTGSLQAEIPPNHPSCPISPGFYLIAIAARNHTPVDAVGAPIFPDSIGQVVSPTTPGSVVASWINNGQSGMYTISLYGVNTPVPTCAFQANANGDLLPLRFTALDSFSGIVEIQGNQLDNGGTEIEATVSSPTAPALDPLGAMGVKVFNPLEFGEVQIEVADINIYRQTTLDLTVTNRHGQTASCFKTLESAKDDLAPICTGIKSLGPPTKAIYDIEDPESGIKRIFFQALGKNVTVEMLLDPGDNQEVIECLDDNGVSRCVKNGEIIFDPPKTKPIRMIVTQLSNVDASVRVFVYDRSGVRPDAYDYRDNRAKCPCEDEDFLEIIP